MNWKFITCLFICGVAALSPAPIRDIRDGEHALPKQSAEQVAQEQKMNGAVGEVGVVLQRTNPDGTGPYIPNNANASSVLARAKLPAAQAHAVENLTNAEKQLQLNGMGGPSPILIGIVVLALIAAVLYAAKVFLEKVGPAPKSFHPADRIR